MKWVAGVALSLCGSAALAAPFCVVTSTGTNCWYYSYPACQDAARSSGGACVVQDEGSREAPQPYYQSERRRSSGAPFCVVTSYGSNCWYYDAPSCQRAAASSRGACVVNPER